MTNRKGIRKIHSLENWNNLSTNVYVEEDIDSISVTSYIVNTKSTGKRRVLLLSTMSPILGVTKDNDKEKPAWTELYNLTKGGTDIVDQRIQMAQSPSHQNGPFVISRLH